MLMKGIFAEGFFIRADFFDDVRWWEGHPVCEISVVRFICRSAPIPDEGRKLT